MWVIIGVFMLVIFVSFTMMRVRTGRKPVLHGALGCSLVAAVIFVFNLIFMCVVLLLGEADVFFAHGIWPVIAWVLFPAILAGVSYRVSKRNHQVNQ